MANEVQVFEMIAGRGGDAAASVNFLAKQTLSIGGAASSAFNRSTTRIRVVSTTGCVIEIGAAPDGLGTTYPIVAGQLNDFNVVAGHKVIAAAGTATAPAVTATIASGGATGTEYTEDAAAAANPTGPVTMLVRRDTPVTNEVSAENDNVAWKGTNRGEGRVNDADANAVLGTTAGAAVITDANGTVQQYLRGLVKLIAALLGPQTAAASLSVTPSADQNPIFDNANGTKTAVTASATIITPPAGCSFIRITTDVDIVVNTANATAVDDGTASRIVANVPEVIPVTAGTAVKALSLAGSATVRCTPLKVR